MRLQALGFALFLVAVAQAEPVKLRTFPPDAYVYIAQEGNIYGPLGWSGNVTIDAAQGKGLRFYYSSWSNLMPRNWVEERMKPDFEAYHLKPDPQLTPDDRRGVIRLPLSAGQWAAYYFFHGGWLLLLAGAAAANWQWRRLKAAQPQILPASAQRRMGRYTLLSSLGKGGFGEVYLATDDQDKQVAVKVLRQELAEDADARKRFFREIEVLTKLRHANIIYIYDWGEWEDKAYLSMEYLQGEPLGNMLARGQRLEKLHILNLLGDMGSALDAIHGQGLVHRDIKPDNIFLENSGRFKLMDFGAALSENLTRATQTGMAMGTPAYMAPEHFQGALDPRSDQYSFGVMVYLLLTGRRPFEKSDPMALAYAHLHDTAPAPSTLNAELSTSVDQVLSRMLSKNPAHRYASVGEAADALRAALGDQPEGYDDATTGFVLS